MSSRGKNHTRGTMQAWREMAAEGDGGKAYFWGAPKFPRVLQRNSRWRPIVRLLAKERGWTFTDAYFHTYFKVFHSHYHFGVKNAER